MGRDVAEDLVQEVFLVLHEKYPDLTTLEELVPLSFQILRLKIKGTRRKAARRGEDTAISVEDVPLPDTSPNPEADYQSRELVERLRRELPHLGERCRELMRLKLEGRSFPEIQAILKVRSINTIYTWDSRCRQKLLERLGGAWERES